MSMHTLPLTLAYSEAPQGAPCAWLVPGESAAEWLQELLSWQIELARVKLLVIARAGEAHVAGALAIVPEKATPRVSPRAQGYRRLANQLYLPTTARIQPHATESELRELLAAPDTTYVWHPALGLLGFERAATLTLDQLFAPPLLRPVRWDHAQPGSSATPRLISIELDELPNIETLLSAGGDGIGDNAGQADQLPPHPAERGPLGKLGGNMLGGIASGIGALAGAAGHMMNSLGAGNSELLQNLRDWAQRKQHELSESLQAERNQQLARLLEMLSKDPDEGLRYALPLAASELGRGIAPPGGRLTPRNVNFNLGGLGGGQAVDGWDAGNYHAKLLERYRTLANRELGLGRYRRAAYIFAQLLGDLRSAASALQTGGHYREAAALYQHKLNSPQEAAKCLVAGQLWSEAIALYETLNEWETIGDLYRQLDDEQLACQAYRRVVDRALLENSFLNAARLLEHKLGAVDEAYACLLRGWPDSWQASRCLQESFQLLARHQRHEETLRRVLQLAAATWPIDTNQTLLGCLSTLATEYPDRKVRLLAADRTRALVSERLETATAGETGGLLSFISKLIPGDRVLARDGQRFVQQRQSQAPKQTNRIQRTGQLTLVRELFLASSIQWKQAVSHHQVLYAAGWSEKNLNLARMHWSGEIQYMPNAWPVPNQVGDILLTVGSQVLVHPIDYPHPVPRRGFPEHAAFPTRGTLFCEGHASFSLDTAGIHYTNQGGLVVIDFRSPSSWNIQRFAQHGEQFLAAQTVAMPDSTSAEEDKLLPLQSAVHENLVLLGWQNQLLVVDREITWTLDLVRGIDSITSSTERKVRTAVGLTSGAVLFDHKMVEWQPFANDLQRPQLAFIEGRRIVAAAQQGIEVYSTSDNQLTLVAAGAGLSETPLLVFPHPTARHFGVLLPSGQVRIYSY